MEKQQISKVLETKTIVDVSVAIFLDVRSVKKTGLYPVKIRVTHRKTQRYYPATDISLDGWEKLLIPDNKPRGELLKTKNLIYASLKTVTDIIEELAPGKLFTFEALSTRLSGGTKDSVLDAFKARIADLKKEGRIGTSVWYSCAKNSIEKYMGDEDLKFADVTVKWLEGYLAHLKKEKKKDTTASINLRALRAIMNEGLRKGVITRNQYSFGEDKFQIPEGQGEKTALSTEQLYKVFDYPIPPEDEPWRDLWIFSFYCAGANIGDILRFKRENIRGNIIQWQRKKTLRAGKKPPRPVRALITEEMQEILDRYAHDDSEYLFPYLMPGLSATREREVIQLVTHNINHKMKKIGKALGIERLTFYVARHSFASISRRSGVDPYIISKSLGHSTLQTTEIYLDALSTDELVESAAKLPRRNGYKESKIVKKPA